MKGVRKSVVCPQIRRDMANLAGQRSLFLSKMSELEKPADGKEAGGLGAERSSFLSKAKYDDIVACLGQWECADKKVRRERWHQGHAWVKKYALFGTGSATVLMYLSDVQKQDVGAADTEDGVGEDGVAAPVEAALDKTVVVSHSGRVFEDLHAIHINGGHCKARTFLNRVKAQFGKSVPERLVQLYVECCPQCTVQKPRKTVTAGHKPILTKGFGARGQVDLIDFQSCPDGSFKYLLNYQDHGIKLYDLQIRFVSRFVPTRAERICRFARRVCRFGPSADSFQLGRSRVCRF